jgi:hypothetical protein
MEAHSAFQWGLSLRRSKPIVVEPSVAQVFVTRGYCLFANWMIRVQGGFVEYDFTTLAGIWLYSDYATGS